VAREISLPLLNLGSPPYEKAKTELAGQEMVKLDSAVYAAWDKLATNPLENQQFLWGVSGPAGSDLPRSAERIIKEHWKGKISEDAIIVYASTKASRVIAPRTPSASSAA